MTKRLTSSSIPILFLAFFAAISASAQSPYTSVASGDWNNAATWSGAGFPVAGDVVTIANGHTITIPAAAACATLTLNGSGRVNHTANVTLAVSGDLTMNGTSQIVPATASATRILNVGGIFSVSAGATNARIGGLQVNINGAGPHTIAGTLTLNSNTGVKTFIGAVTNSGTWTSTTVATAANLIFRGGVSSTAGTFSAGGATFNTTAAQSIGGTAAMSFAAIAIPTGITVTNSNTNTVTITTTLSGAGTFTQGATVNTLAFGGTVIGITTFNAAGTNNTVNYTGASPAIFATTYNHLTVNGSGTATVGGTTSVNGTMTVSSAITNNSTLTVTTALSGASTLTQGASSTLNIGGTSGITGLTASAASNTVNYTGTAQTIKTPTASTYLNLGLSGSGNKTFGAALTISGNLSITGVVADLGTFTHSSNSLTLGGTGQVNGSHGSTGSTATTKNDTYFLSTSSGRVNVTTCTAPSTGAAATYYSRNATLGGNWNDNNSWTTSSDGTGGPLATGVWPRIYDNAVIRSGHTITVDAITDNNYCGISPDGLADPNIGAGGGTGFNGSNIAMFYQTGDVSISGTLSVISGINMMVAGYTRIASTGTFSLTSYLVNAGYFEADASSTLTTLDDLSLTGTSTTIINTNSTSADDLNIDHTIATLCGTGTSGLLNSGGSAINYTNSATVAQICTTFTVTCSGGGCAGFPVVGTTSVILGNVGPGGVGNSSNNKLWLRANDLSLADLAPVASWSDISGNSLTAANGTALEQPTFATNSVNGFPSLLFTPTVTASQNLNLGAPAALNFVPGTNSWSFIAVYRAPVNGPLASQTPNQGTLFSKAWSGGNRNYQYQIDNTPGPEVTFGSYIGNTLSGGAGAPAVNTDVFLISSHTNTTTTKTSFTNETANFTSTAIGAGSDALTEVLIGARRTSGPADGTEGFPFAGNIAEIMMYNSVVNDAQRIIIADYLAAKYAITLSANDFYTMDDVGNENYDYEVAGLGQAAGGSNHKDAMGTGIVRMWNPNGLANGEFLLWGHDNATLVSSTTTVGLAGVDGTIIKERLVREWRVSEIGGDVGTVSISFDLSSFPASLGSNLRLLIDRDGDGFGDNDVTPVSGSLIGSTITFSGVNFQSGDRFTLGNTDLSTPLPIELINFSAAPKADNVVLNWSTASELNNDYFTVERSSGGEVFTSIGKMNGAGTTNQGKKYSLIDHNPVYGTGYYRLKQTDFDGTFTYSKIIPIEFEGSTVPVMDVYPNPSGGNQLNIKISGLKDIESVPVVIYDQMGRECMRLLLMVDKNSGTATKKFSLEKILPSGIYLLKAGRTSSLTRRLVVNNK